MLFPIIKVREGDRVHIVGTNRHDCLYIENNAIHFLDIKGMVGTEFPEESGIYFEGKSDDEYSFSGRPEIEFVTLDELFEIATENMERQTEEKLRADKMYEEFIKKREECERKIDESQKHNGISWDSSGRLY